MARSGRDSPSAKLTLDQILHHMANGWTLVAGKGVVNFGIYLRKEGEDPKSVARHQYVMLRDSGYIAYNGLDEPLSLTERGKKRAASVAQHDVLAGP